jgi:hypothetical protein
MPSASSLVAYAAIGLAIAVAYILTATVFAGLAALIRSRRPGRVRTLHQPGAFVRRELERTDRRFHRHGTAALLFCTCLGLLFALGQRDLWADMPMLAAAAIATITVATGIYASVKCLQLRAYRSRLRALLDIDLEVAQRLDLVQLRGHRLFHSVPVGDRVIDHVIVGATGVFAAQLMVPTRSGAVSASLERGHLLFGPDHGQYSLQPATESFARLAKELGRAVGHPVKVIPTLITPECNTMTVDDDRYLLLNARNCVTLVGWKDSTAFLMDDEIAKISEWLATRCQDQPRAFWRVATRTPHACISRPAFV